MTEAQRKIAVDAMGADRGVSEVVAGVAIALREFKTLDGIVLVGNEDAIAQALRDEGLASDERVEIFHASEVIEMGDKPIQSIKQKKDSSLVRTVELVKLGNCSAAVSCGNTGSLMACSTLRLRPLNGVSKPALATVWPSYNHQFVLLDAGANPQCKPENLVHYAILGSEYARLAIGVKNPRVGLLSIGTEEGKGNELTNETHRLLEKINGVLNYQGLVEGFDLFENRVDVVVTDGFTGNVVLKTSEALWHVISKIMREEFTKSPIRKLGAGLLSGARKDIKSRIDPDIYGGVPLLGLRGNVLKAHGSSSRNAIAHAIRIAAKVVELNLNEHIAKDIEEVNLRMREVESAVPAGEPD